MRKTIVFRSSLAGAALAALLLPAGPTPATAGAAAGAKTGTTAASPVRDAEASPLVSTEWLEKNLDSGKLRIVEVSVDPGVYERGHIPGAHNVAWHTDLVETVSRDIAGPDKFAALARRLGIDRDTTVVLYGDNNNWFAAWGA
ncbi:Rhodanese-like domain-containing protein [Methylobacterium sp. ap11]|nr:Rhodanese-like domain-containing protein [Methylobacterium sp. ap11]